jgi:hypothetical protein
VPVLEGQRRAFDLDDRAAEAALDLLDDALELGSDLADCLSRP